MRFLQRPLRRLGLASYLPLNVLPVRNLDALMQAMGWKLPPILEGDGFDTYEYPADLNFRRRRDAEALAAACRNIATGHFLEIGTAYGETTALMSKNAPEATIHTVNMLPDDVPTAGHLITGAFTKDAIGRVWRAAGCTNVRQIYGNTATWRPDFKPIAFAFIDGCHDADFVVNDTEMVLAAAQPGTVIIWHDFAPELREQLSWVDDVCRGIDRLYRRRRLRGPIFHPVDSLLGIHRIA